MAQEDFQDRLPALRERKIFIENIDSDEMRDGFLVTSHRKKLWNVQINLINEFARVCRKYNLRWFMICGTLLGAARHKGFVPWDDDVDIAMMRPEYEKFRAVAESEFKSPYRADIWCNYRLESDEPSKLTDFSLPQVSRRHFEEFPYSSPFFPLIKIRDERTLFIEFPKERSFNQSIWIDVFPLDSLPPFADKRQNRIFETARLFFAATVHPEIIRDALKNNAPLPVDGDVLQNFIELPYKQRGILLEELLAENFSASEHVGDMREWCLVQRFRSYRSKDFQDIVYLPFETVELPAPAGYDSVLTDFYGDWRTPEKHSSHAAEYSADISWTEYLQKTTGK